jgi:NAD(P)H-hydrate epimerase
MKVITVEKIRYLEEKANAGGLGYAEMMENAGRGTALAISRRLGTQDKRVVVLVGPGNNGGDGLVAAHYLREMGARVTCYIWKRRVEGDANYARVKDDGIFVVWADDDSDYDALRALLRAADVVVDALLGVGVTRPIGGTLEEILAVVRLLVSEARAEKELVEVILRCSERSSPVLFAVDCPTGLDCDTGALDPAAVPVDVTVTYAYPKVGLLRFPGAEIVGDIVVVDIGIPPELAEDVALEMATPELVRNWLPERPRSAHKGTFGRALIVAGSVNYTGAATLAGAGATRVGAGLVTMALPAPIQAAVAARLTEATYLLLPHDLGVIATGAVNVIREGMDDYGALLLGPGLTQETETVAFVHALLDLQPAHQKGRIGFLAASAGEESDRGALPPLVVDADGLNALAMAAQDSGVIDWWRALPTDTILTPHPGEMSRLMGGKLTAREIQADREKVCQRMAAEWGAVVVLKGAFTVVAAPDGRLVVLPFSNPGLATAGSGDVLAGAIVGLRAQGLKAFEAAVAGAYLHGLSGELARQELGDMGMVAGDLPPRLPLALRRLRQGS